ECAVSPARRHDRRPPLRSGGRRPRVSRPVSTPASTRVPRAPSPGKCCALSGGPDEQNAVHGRRALQVLGGAENLEPEAVHDGTSCLVFVEGLRGAEKL